MTRRNACLALLVGLAVVMPACSRSSPVGRARRVVLVTCDTLRPDRLGCYGYARPTSPRCDALAREGVVFDDATTTAPWTSPALSALMTGRLPDEIGVPGGNRFPLPAEAWTLAERAGDAGFKTGAVVSSGILRRPAAELGDVGLAQGFGHFDDHVEERPGFRGTVERLAPATTDAAIGWLEERRSAGEDRFLLWVHYQDPHGPYTPPADCEARVARPATDEPLLPLGTTVTGKGQVPSYQIVEGERAPEIYRQRYDGEVASFDEHLGRLIEWLRAAGWLKDALVVVTSDHGESLGEHDYWFCHGENVYRELVRVPLIVRFPDGTKHVRGETRDGVRHVRSAVTHLDLWPTVGEALGLDPAPNRGISLFSAAIPPGRVSLRALGMPRTHGRWIGYGDGRWEVVVEKDLAPRLYDLAEDPGELHDVAGLHPDVLSDLARREREYVESAAGPRLEGRELRGDSEVERSLHELGYAEGAH